MLEQYGVNFASDQSGIQTGVLRVNCLDCLDRTNSVQTYVGLQVSIIAVTCFVVVPQKIETISYWFLRKTKLFEVIAKEATILK